jgi:hypothetical protein
MNGERKQDEEEERRSIAKNVVVGKNCTPNGRGEEGRYYQREPHSSITE